VARAAAEPSSPDQHSRQQRILLAAEELGSETDFDHVQMLEVAKRAGVAVGTLYRYFPSKNHLFVGVMSYRTARMGDWLTRRRLSGDPADRVYEVLGRANRALLSRPHLAASMMKALNAVHAATVSDAVRTDDTMRDLLIKVAGIDAPTPADLAILRVLLQAWGGILSSSINGRLSVSDADGDLRLACRMLMAGTSVMTAPESAVQ